MEKLQAAIERARAQRQQTATPTGARASENPGDQGRAGARPGDGGGERRGEPGGPWSGLPLLGTPPVHLLRSRIFIDPASREASHFDKLRTKLIQQCTDNGWKRVLVTSPTRACGKTTTCLNLAASISRQRDRRMILWEFDMRRPEMARLLRHRGQAGLSDVLDHKARFEDICVRLAENVIIATNRRSHPNPSNAILADSTADILAGAEKTYQPDLMIFDTPPILAVDDTLALLKHVDAALIVAAAERTTTQQIDVVEREIAAVTNVAGVVLNSCRYMDETYGGDYVSY